MTPLIKQPRFATAKAEVDRLSTALSKIDTRLAEISILLSQQDSNDQPSRHVVAALQFAETGVAVDSGSVIASLNDERQALTPQRDSLAILIARKMDELHSIQRELSGEVCSSMAAKHQAIAVRMLAALESIDAIQQEEADFFQQIEGAGYDARFAELVAWPTVGRIRDNSGSLLWTRARELRNYVN